MAAAAQSLEAAGAGALVVGPAAPYQARRLADRGYPWPVLLDPHHTVATALDLRRQSLARFVFDVRAWTRYVRAFIRHRRQGRITGRYSNVPAVAVVRPDGSVPYLYRGAAIGDYPPVAEVVAAIPRPDPGS